LGSEKHDLRRRSDAARQPLFRARSCLAHHITHRCHNFQKTDREWVEAGSRGDISESMAVGSEGFVKEVKNEWASERNLARFVADGLYTLREPVLPYGHDFDRENDSLRPNNTLAWHNKP
jgi:hypothetical protein